MQQVTSIITIILLFVPITICTSMVAGASQKNPIIDPLAIGNTAFAIELYREQAGSSGNIFFSPYSISSAMAMAYAGAKENTAKEINETLHFNIEQSQLPPVFQQLNHQLLANAADSGQKLNIANSLCLVKGEVDDNYKILIKKFYDAEIFAGNLGDINRWVNKKTNGKIEKILNKLSPNTVCVLLNAIYLKSIWESTFDAKDTYDGSFKVSTEKSVKVPFMTQTSKYQVLATEQFQAISFPYKGNALSLKVFLPRDIDGLAAFEKSLTPENLKKWLTELNKQHSDKLVLHFPKFKLETESSLVTPFKNLGIKDAFSATGKADFSGMKIPKGELYITQIVHKAVLEIDEKGTEAAAATAVVVGARSISMRPSVFRADHPFFFTIQDNKTGTILFMGRLVSPKA